MIGSALLGGGICGDLVKRLGRKLVMAWGCGGEAAIRVSACDYGIELLVDRRVVVFIRHEELLARLRDARPNLAGYLVGKMSTTYDRHVWRGMGA